MSLESRLQEFLDYKRFNASDLAKELGIAQSTLSKALKGQSLSTSKIPVAVLNTFEELSAEWFIRGNGEMLVENIQVGEPRHMYRTSKMLKKTDGSSPMTIYLTKNIRHLRKNKNWSRAHLADQLKIDASEIATWEDANELPPVEMAINLCIVFKIAIEDILFKNLDEEAYRLLEGPAKSYEVLQDEMIELLQFKINAYEEKIKAQAPELAKQLGLK